MGLDMYLSVNEYGYGEGFAGNQTLLGYPVNKVVAEAIYWRKANQIHQWFVDNVQNGNDDCRSYEVSREQLRELYDLCLEALEKKDESLLPTSGGFFFGSTEIDDYYWQQIEHTLNSIDELFSRFNLEDGPGDRRIIYFTYQSSW